MADYMPRGDHELLTWAQNFLSVAQEFQAEAGLTPSEIQEIADLISTYTNDLGTSDAIDLQAKSATYSKNQSRDTLKSNLRKKIERIKVQPTITNEILIGMNVGVPTEKRTSQNPVRPENLTVEIDPNGRIHLEWDAGGNSNGTQYIIQKRKPSEEEFNMLDVSTRRSYTDQASRPGEIASYRIIAQRAGMKSEPSIAITVGE